MKFRAKATKKNGKITKSYFCLKNILSLFDICSDGYLLFLTEMTLTTQRLDLVIYSVNWKTVNVMESTVCLVFVFFVFLFC